MWHGPREGGAWRFGFLKRLASLYLYCPNHRPCPLEGSLPIGGTFVDRLLEGGLGKGDWGLHPVQGGWVDETEGRRMHSYKESRVWCWLHLDTEELQQCTSSLWISVSPCFSLPHGRGLLYELKDIP